MLRYLFLLLVFTIFGCGYQIVGINKAAENLSASFFIERPVNLDPESSYFSILYDESKSFFNYYNLLKNSKDDAEYVLYITLNNVDTSSSITTVTNQTVQSDLRASLSIKAYDKNGKNVFEKSYSSVRAHNITSNISQNVENRNTALRLSLKDMFLDFLYDFKKTKQ
ncbi:MAG: hypothetical protein LDL13_04990 [Calditerrivibrio sp.]|nr:hypothetical protein [Calditerrivibrio sp.]MCA1932914.1 hypothetical protein [Calditerrivibrio sp.]